MEKKLLLVDDEEGIRKVLGISLMDMGYEVLTAPSGEEALSVFRTHAPPIVLTDIKMPGMDGIQLLKALKAENPETEVIMITGHGDMDLAIKSLKLDATDFVTKPIHDAVLEIALKRATDRIVMREQLKSYTENLERMVEEKSARLIRLERLTAIHQAVEGLSSAMRDLADDMGEDLRYFNEMPCFVAIHNPALQVVATNQLYRSRLGRGIGDSSWLVYTPEETAKSCPVGVTFATGQGQRVKRRIRLPDGVESSVMVHTAPIRNSNGDVELVLEISADISEIKRLQDQLDATEKRYQQLFDEAPCYITVQDREFTLLASNRRFKEEFGESTGARCFQIYRQRTEPCLHCPVARTFQDGQPHQGEMVVTSRSGEQIHLLVGTAPLVDEKGRISAVMELSTNITQIRKLQEHLSSLGLMMSSVSHAVKGMLTALDGGIYRIRSGLDKLDSPLMQDGLEDVQIIADRIRNAILDILYYAKEREIQPEMTDVQNVIDDVVQIVDPKMWKLSMEWICRFDPDLGGFMVDRGALRTALVNILENAVEACLEDTSRDTHRIEFTVRKEESRVVFEIRDNGIGMDPEVQNRVFALFFSSKGQRGTGLGLFIARKVVQQHQGTITFSSEKGVGTTFVVRIPIFPEAGHAEPADVSPVIWPRVLGA
jgi:PAS domain S-box-containing protein